MLPPLPFIKFIIILFIATRFAHGHAQGSFYVEEQRAFYGGLVAGANFTQVDGDNYSGYHHAGFNVGGGVFAPLGTNMMAGLELLYVQKGSRGGIKDSYLPGLTILDYSIDIDYAEVPVMLYYKDRRWNHLGAGFAYGRLVKTTENVTSKPVHDFKVEDYPFHKNELSFLMGGSFCIRKGLFANVRFQYSLIEVRGTTPEGISWNGQYSNVWTFRLMYVFGRGGEP